MLRKPTVIFFGSFQDYSTKVARALRRSPNISLAAIVTTPPAQVISRGKKVLKKTHTYLWAEKNNIKIISPKTLNSSNLPSFPVDYFIVAGYSQILPKSWLQFPKIAPLNLHFSLLPRWRGANPAEWAILAGDTLTGVSLIKMDQDIDTGPILTQESIAINPGETRETLYEKLYSLASKLIIHRLPLKVAPFKVIKPQPKKSPTPYARKLERPDGFIPWKTLKKASSGQKIEKKDLSPLLKEVYRLNTQKPKINILERAPRALSGFPGLWTQVSTSKGQKRLKIISAHLKNNQLGLDKVQLEGHQPSTLKQLKSSLL